MRALLITSILKYFHYVVKIRALSFFSRKVIIVLFCYSMLDIYLTIF